MNTIAPSILSADFARLEEHAQEAIDAGGGLSTIYANKTQ